MRTSKEARKIVESTTALSRKLGLTIVAEGVEDGQTLGLLEEAGCDFAQGYLISRPLVPADVPAFVRQANQLLPASDSTVLQIRALDQLTARFRS